MAIERCPVHERVVNTSVSGAYSQDGHAACPDCQRENKPGWKALAAKHKSLVNAQDKSALSGEYEKIQAGNKTLDDREKAIQARETELQAREDALADRERTAKGADANA